MTTALNSVNGQTSIAESSFDVTSSLVQPLCSEWLKLTAKLLPFKNDDSIWRFSRPLTPDDPEQGWKIHVSATILTAGRVLETISPLLLSDGVLFKTPGTLPELMKINSGIYYGYSQVGKIFTIYPRNDDEAMNLIAALSILTNRFPAAPKVPFDLRFKSGGCVYYRYGAFEPLAITAANNTKTAAVRHPNGDLIPDARQTAKARPDWIENPLFAPPDENCTASPLTETFKIFAAIAQRGKGGVYRAFDFSDPDAPRECLVKEGRRAGEVEWDGRDGLWRARYEKKVLEKLRKSGVPVPRLITSFTSQNNYYLILERVTGETLLEFVLRQGTIFSIVDAVRYGLRLARLFARIHAAGWVWRDAKPANIIVTPDGKEFRPLDFEGACPIDFPDPTPWGTPPFVPPEAVREFVTGSRLPEDLFALGTMLFLFFEGDLPAPDSTLPHCLTRRGVPPTILELIEDLTSPQPARRPSAQMAFEILSAFDSR